MVGDEAGRAGVGGAEDLVAVVGEADGAVEGPDVGASEVTGVGSEYGSPRLVPGRIVDSATAAARLGNIKSGVGVCPRSPMSTLKSAKSLNALTV